MGSGRRYSKTNAITLANTGFGFVAYLSVFVFLSKLCIVHCVLRTIADAPLTLLCIPEISLAMFSEKKNNFH